MNITVLIILIVQEYERVASRFSIVDSAVNKTTDAAMSERI